MLNCVVEIRGFTLSIFFLLFVINHMDTWRIDYIYLIQPSQANILPYKRHITMTKVFKLYLKICEKVGYICQCSDE